MHSVFILLDSLLFKKKGSILRNNFLLLTWNSLKVETDFLSAPGVDYLLAGPEEAGTGRLLVTMQSVVVPWTPRLGLLLSEGLQNGCQWTVWAWPGKHLLLHLPAVQNETEKCSTVFCLLTDLLLMTHFTCVENTQWEKRPVFFFFLIWIHLLVPVVLKRKQFGLKCKVSLTIIQLNWRPKNAKNQEQHWWAEKNNDAKVVKELF